METIARLERLFWVLLEEAKRNPELARRLAEALEPAVRRQPEAPQHAGDTARDAWWEPSRDSGATHQPPEPAAFEVPAARGHPVLDPFAVYDLGWEEMLRERLSGLSVDQLKDVVVEYGWNRGTGAMDWTKADRLIDLIVKRVVAKAGSL